MLQRRQRDVEVLSAPPNPSTNTAAAAACLRALGAALFISFVCFLLYLHGAKDDGTCVGEQAEWLFLWRNSRLNSNTRAMLMC